MAATLDARVRLNTAEFSGGMQRVLRESNSAVGRLNQSFSTLRNVAGFGAIGAGMTSFLGSIGQATLETERLKAALSATTGNELMGASQLKEVRALASDIGLGVSEAAKAMIQFQSAGMSASDSMRTIKAGFNAILSTGGGSNEFSRFSVAIQQLRASPKPLQEEINQLREALPTTAKLMKETFGASRAEDLQKLGLSGRQFVDSLLLAMEKLPQIGDTLGKQIGRVGAQWEALQAQIGETFAPTAQAGMKATSWLLDVSAKLRQFQSDTFEKIMGGDPEKRRQEEGFMVKILEAAQQSKQATADRVELERKNAEALRESARAAGVLAVQYDGLNEALRQEANTAWETSLDATRKKIGDAIGAKRELQSELFRDFQGPPVAEQWERDAEADAIQRQGPPQQSEREKEAWRELARREGMSSSERKAQRRADREMENNARKAADRQTRDEMRKWREEQRAKSFDNLKNNQTLPNAAEEQARRKKANRESAKAAMQTTESLLTTIKDTLKNLATA